MKSMLIVTEQFTIGGLETHICGEISCLSESGVEVHLATGNMFDDALLPPGLSSVSHSLPLDPTSTPEGLLAAINQLTTIIRKHSIDGVHIHPFTSIIPAVAAAELERIPYAITLHGPASVASYGPIYDLLIKDVIFSNAKLIVAVSPEVQRLLSIHATDESVICIPNAISFSESEDTASLANSIDQRWLVVSRLDQFKIKGIIDFCSKAHSSGIPGVLIVGDGPAKQQLIQMLEDHGLAGYVTLLGVSTEVHSLMQKCAGVAGMGRVVLEGVASRKPVVIVGYDGVKGVVDEVLLAQAAEKNFSGRGLPTIGVGEFSAQLRDKVRETDISVVFEAAKAVFNDRDAWALFLDRMSSVATPAPTALTGLYFSLSGSPITGTVPFLYSQEVLDRMGAVVCGLNYYDPRLSAAVSLCRQRLERTERDGQIASLKQAVAERDRQIAYLNIELDKIKQSLSWRVTSPFRYAKNLITSPKRTAYQVSRSLFWRLPSGVRQVLHGPRHAFVRFLRDLPISSGDTEEKVLSTDLSWHEFREKILSRRADFKGVLIQENIVEWNIPLYQRPQHMSVAFGKLGYLVIYRTPNRSADNINGFREVSRNVWITNKNEVEEIQGVVQSFYSTDFGIKLEHLNKHSKRNICVYEYIDHIAPDISGSRNNIKRLLQLKHFAFHGGANYIVASAKKLYQEAVNAVGKERVILVPNGVDTAHYRNPIHKKTALPSSLLEFEAKYKAVVGYFGALAPWLWYDCIQELAAARPELGLVFIGPDYYGGAGKLPKLNNILYLGSVDYKILPAYAKKFDICFIPFKLGDIAKTTSPLKLFEYFALEKPVVVTSDMDECTAYTEVFRGGSATELSEAIDAALLVKDQEQFKVGLRELADQNDWIQRARAMEVCFQGISNE